MDLDAAEGIDPEVNVYVYVTFVSPGAEDQRCTYSVEVPHVGQVDGAHALTCEWQTDTQQLIKQLAVQVPQLTGRPVRPLHLSWTMPRCSHRTSQTRCDRGLLS